MSTRNTALVLHAAWFATLAHDGQRRKYTDEPYVAHPFRVASMVSTRTEDDAVVAAAILHDVLEDTKTTYEDLRVAFGHRVADLVNECTDIFTKVRYPDLNRAKRKELELDRIATISEDAQLIKGCDILDNLTSIREHDPAFYKVFLSEKIAVVGVMPKLDPQLRAMLALHGVGD